MKRIHAVLAFGIAVLLAGFAFWFLRDPWARLDQPQTFLFEDVRILRVEDRAEAVGLEEEYGFFVDALYQMQDFMVGEARDGYLIVDSEAGTVTAHLSGRQIVAPIPRGDEAAAFDVSQLGVPPVWVRRNGNGATVDAAFDGIGSDLLISMDFVPADDASVQIARQKELADAHERAFAAWQEDLKPIRDAIDAGPDLGAEGWRHTLPGLRATVLVPDWASFGRSPDFPRTVFFDPADKSREFIIFAAKPGDGKEIFGNERERFLDLPEDRRDVLLDQDDALIVNRIEGAFNAVFSREVDGIDYIILLENADLQMAREVWAVAQSLSDQPLAMNPALGADFDALARLRDRGAIFEPTRDLSQRVSDGVADLFQTKALIGTSVDQFSDHQMDEGTDGFNPWSLPNMECTVANDDGAPLSQIHEVFFRYNTKAPPTAGFTVQAAEYIRSGAFVSGDESSLNPFPELPRTKPQWFQDGPLRSVGSEGPLYYIYFARPLGQLRLVCRVAGENPLGVRAAEQIGMALPLPEVDPQPDWVIRDLRRYGHVGRLGDDLFEARVGEGELVVLDAQGDQLVDRSFGYIWDLNDIRGFEGGSSSNSVGLWSYDGLQLLPEDYSDIEARESADGQPQVRTWRTGHEGYEDFLISDLRRAAAGE